MARAGVKVCFFLTGESVIVTQRAFHAYFVLHQIDTVPYGTAMG